MRIHSFFVACLGMSLLAGCPAPAVYQSAKPLAPGKYQLGAGLGSIYLKDLPQETTLPGADLEVWARRGVSANLDLGLRLFTLGVEASAKWRFIEGKRDIAIMPGLSVYKTNESTVTTEAIHSFLSLPLLVTQNLSESWSITYGPRALGGLYKSNASSTHVGALLGGLVLFAYDLGPVTLMPEIDVSRTVLGDVPIDGWMTHLGLGVSWDLSD